MTRYTSSDIEIHLANYCEGLDISAAPIDEQATQRRVEELVRAAVEAAYPQYSVSIYSEHAYGAENKIVSLPDGLDYEETEAVEAGIMDAIERAVNMENGGEEWIVEVAHNA